MERFNFKSDNVVLIMIILLVLVFFKAFLYFISFVKYHRIFISDENFEKFRNIYSDLLDIIIMLIALFILLLRKNNSIFATILAIIILFKGFVHFFIDYNLYKYTNLSDNTIKGINEYKKQSIFITNSILFFATIYMIKTIFYN